MNDKICELRWQIYIYFVDLPTSNLIANLHDYDVDTIVKHSYDKYWKEENQCCKYCYITIKYLVAVSSNLLIYLL